MIFTDSGRSAMLKGIAAKLNQGANSTLAIYVGAVLAAEITLTNPVELSIVGAVMTFKAPPQVLAVASGVPTAAKLLDPSGVVIAELDVPTEVTLDKDKIYMGGYVGLMSMTMGLTA